MDVRDYRKIILVGNCGSGKSWMSKQLAAITGYPLYHLDKEHWLPGWCMPPREEKIARQREIMSGERWIIDGNYDSTMALRFAEAELIIFMDINRVVCMISAMKRTGKKRSDLPDYLEEPKIISREFYKFCKLIWSYRKTGRKTVMTLHERYAEKAFLQVRTRSKLNRLIRAWDQTSG